MGELAYLALAYAVIWLLLFGYVLSLAHREQELRRDVTLITQVLREKDAAAQAAAEVDVRVASNGQDVREASHAV